ncbi:hypothetical protein [Ferrovum sp. PN-J185]|nr:hypothetical protein [Ferrovum sp. PN-J185]KXW55346.1 hypothetical protein FV185_15920 [Ferrovum sp. PN-J185]
MKYILILLVILVAIFSAYMLNNNAKAASLTPGSHQGTTQISVSR